MNKIKRARFDQGLTQMLLYKKTKIWPSRLSLIENNLVTPSEKEKAKLARALKVSVEELFPATPKGQESENANAERQVRSQQ
jgi:transcriptional regulator with XRE-family HTH domain